ncbi:MAG: ribonuclease HII [Patescibacteria group bacterium]
MKKITRTKDTVGIDEVGRGPLAGPVAVGAVLIYAEHSKTVSRIFPIIKDSKKLSQKSRGEWFLKIREAEKAGFLISSVQFVSSKHIDKNGIAPSIRKALAQALEAVSAMDDDKFSADVLLDGGLQAPKEYRNQKTIIKGDEKMLVIALASIVAKVTRDARMIKFGKKLPAYGFEKHKGYGTRAHYTAIKKHGVTEHHRKSYLKNLDKR